MSLLVAIATAAVFAVFGFPFRFYHCWFTWRPFVSNIGVLLYLVIAGGGAGFVGWLAAHLANVPASTTPAIDGFFYGIAGTLAVRADFRTHRARGPQEVQGAASLLGKGIEWCTGLLDHLTRHRAKRWLQSLDDQQLLAFALDLIHEVATHPGITAQAKKSMMENGTNTMAQLQIPAQHDTARAQLIYFCLDYLVREHLAKTAVAVAPPPAMTPTIKH